MKVIDKDSVEYFIEDFSRFRDENNWGSTPRYLRKEEFLHSNKYTTEERNAYWDALDDFEEFLREYFFNVN